MPDFTQPHAAAVVLIVAVADNGVIGRRGAIPWRIPEDLRRFKALTLGKPVVMGRKTWDSLPKKPLPSRTNIVVTRDPGWTGGGAVAVHSLDAAIARARTENPPEIAIIGGAEIYREALPRANRIERTEIHEAADGDTFFPRLDGGVWRETARSEHATADGLRYSNVTLVRG